MRRLFPLLSVCAGLAAACPAVGDDRGAGPAVRNVHPFARERPEVLAADARRLGKLDHGVRLFFQPELGCARCHVPGTSGTCLGPDLSRESRRRSAAELVEAVLDPSKVVSKGYETVTVATTDGRTLTAVLAEERPDALVIRDPAQDGRRVVIPRAKVEDRRLGGPSLMPAGLANLLGTRYDFLDLVRYLIEVTEQGPARALELRPSPWDLALPPLPDYERNLDHAGLIAALDERSYRAGETIYQRACVNCHGTKDRPGSLPTSLRFASGTFKNGADPYAMYQTLTRGYGQMVAQSWIEPRKKYDVIHYIREAFLKPFNPSQYVAATPDYLARLPKGTAVGPTVADVEPWAHSDYGPSLMLTVEVGEGKASPNIAYKGIAVRLDPGPGGVAKGMRWVVYDHDTMAVVGAWSGREFVDWEGINFNGKHEVHPKAVGRVHVANPVGPGWADPETGTFDDPRMRGRDGRPYGPMPRRWTRYKGLYHHGGRVVLAYTVGDADVLESPGVEVDGSGNAIVFTRTLNVGRSARDLAVRVGAGGTAVALSSTTADGRVRVARRDVGTVVEIPAAATPVSLKVLFGDDPESVEAAAARKAPPESLEALTRGGPRRWGEALSTLPVTGVDSGPFASDVLTTPVENPWACQVRLSGFDFFPDGRRAAACTWDGDVWTVEGVDDLSRPLIWRRVASGLFQPLGLKIVGGAVFVGCRDQIVILRDRNGDGETDFYECFNTDHQVTEHFHEFAMDLQADAEGNLYYAKAARHGKTALVPQHGTLLKVGKDGSTTEILATGFRAPNGACLNPDGSYFLSDQEGHWIPKNRINRVVKGGFYGNMWGYHGVTDPSDRAMEQPLCWITNAFDRSPAELFWVTSDRWGPLKGSLLSLSYGYGKVFVVPFERVEGQVQGGMCELPVAPFSTGVMRGRFHPGNGHLYLCGLYGWAGNQTQPGGFYRLRATGKTFHVPVGLAARRQGVDLTFSAPLDRASTTDKSRYAVRVWSLKRTANYGSPHLDETPLSVKSSSLSADGRTVSLEIPDIRPTMGMQIVFDLKGAGGEPVFGRVHNTIHHLREPTVESRNSSADDADVRR
jgi:putative heme-binding domain-containing protein